MRRLLPYVCGSVAGLVYGLLSDFVTGNWNVACMFTVGLLVAIVTAGFRRKDKRLPQAAADTERKPVVSMAARPSPAATPGAAPAAPPVAVASAPVPAAEPVVAPAVVPATTAVAGETPEQLWERARTMVHNVIPNPVEDAEYLDLVISAAERGHVPALAKLGDYAFRRGAFVEAYFWTKLAYRRQELADPSDTGALREIDAMRRTIAREWNMAGQPLEIENVYNHFPEVRGELGRALLRIDSGIDVKPTQKFIRHLAKKGNPDAALFVV